MSFSPERLRGFLDEGQARCVAFSGGLDSTVLLHALTELRDGAPLRALHVNHGLHPDAGEWAGHCKAAAARLGIECKVLEVAVDCAHADGPEAAAREARYAALAAALDEGEILMTAQHADDQAETVLLALLRGSGPDGIAAMPRSTALGRGRLLRPLLEFERGALRAWAEAQGLEWLEDPANRDERYARSWMRARVMPALRERWPGVAHSFARSAQLAAEAAALLDEFAAQDLGDSGAEALPLALLQSLPPARGRNLLRAWLKRRGLPLPPYPRLVEAHRQLLDAGPDRNPAVAWPGGVIRRFRDQVHVHPPLAEIPADWSAAWDGRQPLALPAGLGSLRLEPAESGLDAGRLANTPLTVRFRAGGERIRPAGDAHHSAVKHLLQRAGVPPWERGRIPLLFAGNELVAVGDTWFAADWSAEDPKNTVKVAWAR